MATTRSRIEATHLNRLDDLRDVVHARAEDGHPVVVPDPGTEHGRRLLHTLGAQTTVTMTLDEYIELVNR